MQADVVSGHYDVVSQSCLSCLICFYVSSYEVSSPRLTEVVHGTLTAAVQSKRESCMARQINRRSRLGPLSDPIGLTSEAPFLPVDSIQDMIPMQTRLESER